MSKTWEIEITTRHEVEADTEGEAIDNADNTNILEFVRVVVISGPEVEEP